MTTDTTFTAHANDQIGMDSSGQCHAAIVDTNGDTVEDITWDALPAYPAYPTLNDDVEWLDTFDPAIFNTLAKQAFAHAGWHIPAEVPDAPWHFPTWKIQ